MKRRILLPTDFSKTAQNAIDYAISLFKQFDCEFYILNTYNIDSFTMELTAARDLQESKQNSIDGLSSILKKLLDSNKSQKHKYHMVSECGFIIDIMNELIDKLDIDIVIMGTKGNTDSMMQIYGSNTVLAMEKIRNCPVLAIPSVSTFKTIKEIVFPTAYKIHFKSREFKYLVDIAKISDASIRVLHVADKDENLDKDQLNNQKLLKDYFEDLNYSFHTVHNKKIQVALDTFIETHDIDLVVFINRKHNFLSRLFSNRKPMMKELGNYSTIPILVLHDFKN